MKETIKNLRNDVLAQYHKVIGFMTASHNDYPASSMTVIGVTGTNGKTSTCYMIYNILLQAGLPVAMMTTVSTSIMGETTEQEGHMTTADTKTLNKRLVTMRDRGVKYLVLEVSSHALAQGRIFGVPIDIAVLTNVTPEHLDYHRTMKRYRKAKLKLFKMAARNGKRGGRGIGIINADDPASKMFANKVAKPITYGLDKNKADIVASRIKLMADRVEYYTRINKQAYHIKVPIAGRCYVYNSLAAIAACQALGISKKDIEEGLANMPEVDGRMNSIKAGQPFDIIVDYAHTPDAYQQILPDIKKSTSGQVIIVCGAAGNRDNSKFAKMGQLAYDNSDLVILTEEDAGKLSVRQLSDKVAAGIRQAGGIEEKDFVFIDDRYQAIKQALTTAQKGDTVLLLGMGHEKVIDRVNGPEPWNDKQTAIELVNQLKLTKKKRGRK